MVTQIFLWLKYIYQKLYACQILSSLQNIARLLVTDRINVTSNAVAFVFLSVRPFVLLYLWNRLTIDLELLCVSRVLCYKVSE